jgi:glycerophosphoryl diester phosphodiesterase
VSHAQQVATKRVGHGGASALVRGNTLASFDAALAIGVDMVEFDVRAWRGRLVLAHTILHARLHPCPSLDAALGHVADARFEGVELNLDVKHTGCERALVDALRDHGMLERTLVSSQVPAVLDRLRDLEPELRTGISIGGRLARRGNRWRDWRGAVLRGLEAGRFDALMAHHSLVDHRLAEDVDAHGGELYAWTVNERATIHRLVDIGVNGITTADPRLFAAAA